MKYRIFFSLILAVNFLNAQDPIPDITEVFRDDVIPRIDITIPPSSLNAIYNNVTSDQEYQAIFVFDNGTIRDTVEDIGFRLRGNTSRFSAKKSFKISFNTYVSGRKYYGLEKMNLNGEHNDPSIIRSKLCWDLHRDLGIPASRSNHVDVYINGQYYGLYMNVEHIDEEFVDLRFGNQDGNLYKCYWGVDFNYLNDNPNSYKIDNNGQRIYELKTNLDTDDYSDLAEFIDILNNEPAANFQCRIEEIFNVQSFLKSLAVEVMTGHWDGPSLNKNNCYLYKNTATGKFEYIPFDLDNTIGVNFIQIWDMGTRDIYQWYNTSENRPLFERFMVYQEYKDLFSYYINDIIQNHWDTTAYFPHVDQIKNMLTPSAINDTYRTLDYGFSIDEFHRSYVETVRPHTTHGLKEYITTRNHNANSQLTVNDIKPVLDEFDIDISTADKTIDFEIKVFDDQQSSLTVEAHISEEGGNFITVTLYDDGQHGDKDPNDGIYGGNHTLSIESGTVDYYITATDNQNQEGRYPRCADKSFNFNPPVPNLVINELLASNDAAYPDGDGEFDDWIEIYNPSNSAIDLAGIFLSDNPNNPNKWELPNISLATNEYLLIWADEDGHQGDRHANFKLSKDGETLGLYLGEENGFAVVDQITYPSQTTDVSYGRLPNGVGEFQVLDFISPRQNNEDTTTVVIGGGPPTDVDELTISPNPFNHDLTISHPYLAANLRVYSISGQLVFSAANIDSGYVWKGVNQSGIELGSGVYLITLIRQANGGKLEILDTRKVVITR